jgi:hypothetical protein
MRLSIEFRKQRRQTIYDLVIIRSRASPGLMNRVWQNRWQGIRRNYGFFPAATTMLTQQKNSFFSLRLSSSSLHARSSLTDAIPAFRASS